MLYPSGTRLLPKRWASWAVLSGSYGESCRVSEVSRGVSLCIGIWQNYGGPIIGVDGNIIWYEHVVEVVHYGCHREYQWQQECVEVLLWVTGWGVYRECYQLSHPATWTSLYTEITLYPNNLIMHPVWTKMFTEMEAGLYCWLPHYEIKKAMLK